MCTHQVSIYVNPTQFAPGEDLDTYPRDAEGDLRKLASVGVDAAFVPATLYPPPGEVPHETYVTVTNLQVCSGSGGGRCAVAHSADSSCVCLYPTQRGLCGVSRPTHFQGVATIVCKLFNIMRPDVAVRSAAWRVGIAHVASKCRALAHQVFGRKDYQQFKVLSRMVRDLDLGVAMVGAPLVREADGLALSSRNVRLTPEHRAKAVCISQALRAAAEAYAGGGAKDGSALRTGIAAAITAAGGVVDYVEVVAQDTLEPMASLGTEPAVMLVAAKFGAVRLLDNWELPPRQ